MLHVKALQQSCIFSFCGFLFLLFIVCCVLLYSDCPRAETRTLTWTDLLPESNSQYDEVGGIRARSQGDEAKPNLKWDQKYVRIHGFVVPVERTESMGLATFLLVPYFGACIHVPPPPENQSIYVLLKTPLSQIKAMDQITVEGLLRVQKTDSDVAESVYTLEEAKEAETPKKNWAPHFFAFLAALLCALSLSLGWMLPLQSLLRGKEANTAIMALSSGMMLTLGLSALLRFTKTNIILYLAGFLLLLLLERFMHEGEGENIEASQKRSVFAIGLHTMPECFFVLSTALGDLRLGFLLALTMMTHNIPLGLSVSFLSRGQNRQQRMACIVGASILPLMLALGLYYGLRAFVPLETIQYCYPFAGGSLSAIALCELLPQAAKGSKKIAFFSFLFGVIFLSIMIFFLFKY
ncbi:MAG: DUF3299 domain-containing protein [Desulfovibrio sp.]|nr:DUF3299 domain-containing protein [Desulfovibrio sp.]